MAKVSVQENGCWLWTGALLKSNARGYRVSGGYGIFRGPGMKTARAHRVSYEHHVGPIPDGMTLDHRCHTSDPTCPGGNTCPHRACVNPAHLDVTTRKRNVLMGSGPTAVNAVKTHCIHGHEFTEANTRWYSNHTMRSCRECARLRAAAKRDPNRTRRNVKPPAR